MAYWQLYYHFVWTTANRAPLVTDEVTPILYTQLRTRAERMGATVYAIGGTAWHVHVVVAVPPRWSPALFVGQLKSQTSAALNRTGLVAGRFAWHEGYGVYAFDRRQLRPMIDYVEQQRAVHATRHEIRVLELVDGGAPAAGSQRGQFLH
ncbi:MAG: IS200/IS605 family transposase [Caldilineaceae bacterium]